MIGCYAASQPQAVAQTDPWIWLESADEVTAEGGRYKWKNRSTSDCFVTFLNGPVHRGSSDTRMLHVPPNNPGVFQPTSPVPSNSSACTVIAVWAIGAGHPVSVGDGVSRFNAVDGWVEMFGSDLPMRMPIPAGLVLVPGSTTILCIEYTTTENTVTFRLYTSTRDPSLWHHYWMWTVTGVQRGFLSGTRMSVGSTGHGLDIAEIAIWNDQNATRRDAVITYLVRKWFQAPHQYVFPAPAHVAIINTPVDTPRPARVTDLFARNGNQWLDATGRGRHAIFHGFNAVTCVTDRFGGGYRTPGHQTTQWIQLPIAALSVVPNNQWTLITWMELTSHPVQFSTYFHNMSSETGASNDFLVEVLPTLGIRPFANIPSDNPLMPMQCQQNTPFMLAIVISGSDVRFLSNDNPTVITFTDVSPPNLQNITFWILNQEIDAPVGTVSAFDSNQACEANWYRITLYDQALTTEQIAAHFRMTAAPFA